MLNNIFEMCWEFVKSNAFLSGGAVLGAAGILIAYLKAVPGSIWAWFKRRIIIEIDIPDRDESFLWLDKWLTFQKYQKRCRLLTIKSSKKKRDYCYAGGEESDDVRARPEISLSPAPGTHYFFYRHRLIILHRERKDGSEQKGGSFTMGFRETFNIKLFSRNRQLVLDLLNEARELSHPESDDRISVYMPNYGDWYRAAKKLPRPIESVIMEGNMAEKLLEDMREFLVSEVWYNKLGIPYRKGYLLAGSPGNGKSSLVMAVASALKLDISVLNLSASGVSDDRLIELISNIPARTLLLIEDIDCIFQQREKQDDKDTVTFSGLLNAIDGIMAGNGRILFLTTNHMEKLDPALIRPGRCDVIFNVKNATQSQAEGLFLRFFPENKEEAKEFGKILKPDTISMAQIQGYLMEHRKSAKESLTMFQSMVDLK